MAKNNRIKLINKIADQSIIELMDLIEKSDSDDEEFDENFDDLFSDLLVNVAAISSMRYIFPFKLGSIAKSRQWCSDVLLKLDEPRFKQMLRVNWHQFNVIHNLIEKDAVFTSSHSGKQFPVALQLGITLYRLGSYGEGASIRKIAGLFGISDGGTIDIITKRVFKAVMNLQGRFLNWPDKDEKEEIVKKTHHELPYCIGYLDGTEIKLQ